jgi:hypothetical protein
MLICLFYFINGKIILGFSIGTVFMFATSISACGMNKNNISDYIDSVMADINIEELAKHEDLYNLFVTKLVSLKN